MISVDKFFKFVHLDTPLSCEMGRKTNEYYSNLLDNHLHKTLVTILEKKQHIE